MAITAHVYQIHIAADAPSRCGRRSPTRSGPGATSTPPRSSSRRRPGQPYRTVTADGARRHRRHGRGDDAPDRGRPGRFVQTWQVLYDADLAAGAAQPGGVDGGGGRRRPDPGPARARRPGRPRRSPGPTSRTAGCGCSTRSRRSSRPAGRCPPADRRVGAPGRPRGRRLAPTPGGRGQQRRVRAARPAAARPRRTRSCSGGPTPRRTTGSGRRSRVRPTRRAPTTWSPAPWSPPASPSAGWSSAERCLAQCERPPTRPTSTSPTPTRPGPAPWQRSGRSDEAADAAAAARAVPIADPEDLAAGRAGLRRPPGLVRSQRGVDTPYEPRVGTVLTLGGATDCGGRGLAGGEQGAGVAAVQGGVGVVPEAGDGGVARRTRRAPSPPAGRRRSPAPSRRHRRPGRSASRWASIGPGQPVPARGRRDVHPLHLGGGGGAERLDVGTPPPGARHPRPVAEVAHEERALGVRSNSAGSIGVRSGPP